jgi:hypothetical protein
MEEKSAEFLQILWASGAGWPARGGESRNGAFDGGRTDITTPLGCGHGCSIYNLVRVFD